jgi:hypothetical protein
MRSRGIVRPVVIVAAVAVMISGCSALPSSVKASPPPVAVTPAAVTSSATPDTAASSTTTSATPGTVPLPAGEQWLGKQEWGVRFAVPVSWEVIDPSKFAGMPALKASPMIKDIATRMGVTPETLTAQMQGIKVMAIYPGRSRITAELTSSAMSAMPSDAALSTEIGTITGHPAAVQITHRNSSFGDTAVVRYSLTAKGLLAPVTSEMGAFVVQGQVWILDITSADARAADRAFNHAVDTLAPW